MDNVSLECHEFSKMHKYCELHSVNFLSQHTGKSLPMNKQIIKDHKEEVRKNRSVTASIC